MKFFIFILMLSAQVAHAKSGVPLYNICTYSGKASAEKGGVWSSSMTFKACLDLVRAKVENNELDPEGTFAFYDLSSEPEVITPANPEKDAHGWKISGKIADLSVENPPFVYTQF